MAQQSRTGADPEIVCYGGEKGEGHIILMLWVG